MKWIGITGSWRKSSPEMEADLKREVTAVLQNGAGIVAGGALGVDYLATELALIHAPDGSRLKIFLPTSLDMYIAHYRKRAKEGVITVDQSEALIQQLMTVDKLGSLISNLDQTEPNEKTYFLRNTEVINASDEILAFQINASAGTQDTIDKARQRGIPVEVFTYTVE
ncbi:MAG TPA: hypothetical protein VK497_02055 [Candidatus Saccharimonadales bacterium]|nr:hypothetical protein [Candidatus Saccharimonadales bacterium]